MHGLAAAPHVGVVDDVVVHERRRVDELDDRRKERRVLACIPAHPGGHQQDRRTNALAAALLDVVADGRNQRHLRFEMPHEFALDLFQVVTNRLEHLRKNDG